MYAVGISIEESGVTFYLPTRMGHKHEGMYVSIRIKQYF